MLRDRSGNFTGWGHRHYLYTRYRSQLGPTCGAMGYGVPAAIAAKSVVPERPVDCPVGVKGNVRRDVSEPGASVKWP